MLFRSNPDKAENIQALINGLIGDFNQRKFIIYDFETDTNTDIHIPNHVEVDCLRIDEELTHDYDKCLQKKESFTGYGCDIKFCEWLFTKDNSNSTVIAHNGGGYDNKFILKWCSSTGMKPDCFIRQGSKIAYMSFKKFKIRFVDSYSFFQCKLKDLSKTFEVDTVKGYFPHLFNKPENQDYIGKIPEEEMFGVKNKIGRAHV